MGLCMYVNVYVRTCTYECGNRYVCSRCIATGCLCVCTLMTQVHPYSFPEKITQDPETKQLTLELRNGEKHSGFDQIIVTIGRVPEVEELGLKEKGVSQVPGTGCIEVDQFQNTSVKGIYALGDVCGDVSSPQSSSFLLFTAGRQ